MVTEAVMVSMEEIAEGGKAEWEEEGARTEQRERERERNLGQVSKIGKIGVDQQVVDKDPVERWRLDM